MKCLQMCHVARRRLNVHMATQELKELKPLSFDQYSVA